MKHSDTAPGLLGFGYAGIQTPQAERWRTVGPELFGFALAPDGPGGAILLRTDERHHRLAVHPGDRNRLLYIGWDVADSAALDAVADRIEAAGLSIHRDDIALRGLRHAGRVAWFVDPFGQRHELAVGPRDQSAFVPGKPMRGTFVTGNAGFGHVVMVTPDLDATTAFYTEVLGFRPSDAFRFAAAPGVRGLHHLMFELSDLDDVGRAYDRLADFDIPATVTLGRHPNDCMLSFYARVPGGFDIEWGHKPQAAA